MAYLCAIWSYFALFIENYFKLNIYWNLNIEKVKFYQKIAFLAYDMKCDKT